MNEPKPGTIPVTIRVRHSRWRWYAGRAVMLLLISLALSVAEAALLPIVPASIRIACNLLILSGICAWWMSHAPADHSCFVLWYQQDHWVAADIHRSARGTGLTQAEAMTDALRHVSNQ